uniref:Nuclear factor of activated T-cells, cytoplasmic 3-like n=1 Tax=Gouania willdenowi TaxID=441366 RepID=A0A8C5G828_GOUWI
MSFGKCRDDLDFTLLFGEEGRQTAGSLSDVRPPSSLLPPLPPVAEQQVHPSHLSENNQDVAYYHGAFHCPSIQITSIAPNNHVEAGGAWGGVSDTFGGRDQLYLPFDPSYRDPALCPSPCSSLSSRSWVSDLSSCESSSHVYDDVDGDLRDAARLALGPPLVSPLGSLGSLGGGVAAFGVELWQQKYQHPSPQQSPSHSPRTSVTEESWLSRRPTSRPSSRPTSPCGKRRHSSADPSLRSSSPHLTMSPIPACSPRGCVADDPGPALVSAYQDLDVPLKTRRTWGGQLGFLNAPTDEGLETFLNVPEEEEQATAAELFLQVPSHFSWSKPKPGNPPLFRPSSPPPLDWPLPNQYDQCELKLEVQPRSFHRAHYETEGSRGSIKALTGGHPLIKLSGYAEQPVRLLLFIGTADERNLRPHSFYQVHRVTGKTVSTVCQERILECTKVLEILLVPENNMCASIDCAGILKLRNADIELKKGETDVGRKNTRVKVVFRVAVPQPDGHMLWLQTASVPVECSQRSGQELPHVERFRPSSASMDGGEEMILTGSNMSAQSTVMFVEKGPDGRSLWEAEARVLPQRCSTSSIVLEIPPYNKATSRPVQVQFYVSNGKKRRSLAQSFTLVPVVKQECWEQHSISDSLPPQSAPTPHHSSSVPYQTLSTVPPQSQTSWDLCPPLNTSTAFSTSADSQLGHTMSIKQEPEERLNLGSLGLQEITLDDGKKPYQLR